MYKSERYPFIQANFLIENRSKYYGMTCLMNVDIVKASDFIRRQIQRDTATTVRLRPSRPSQVYRPYPTAMSIVRAHPLPILAAGRIPADSGTRLSSTRLLIAVSPSNSFNCKSFGTLTIILFALGHRMLVIALC